METFRPFEQKARTFDQNVEDWNTLYRKPYDKNAIDPYTKLRIILMNGIEVEAALFGHNFNRMCEDQDLRRSLAMIRRVEQQQQKSINWLSPGDETQLETTIGYEHLAVDLTAWLAMHEPDAYVKACMDFALLEDFDHLYRYANLLELDMDIPAQKLVGELVEITPGRPTIAEHRYPMESVKKPCDFTTADIRTKLGALILTAGEQQTMNFYMNIGPTYPDDNGRQLYQEIGMIEEQHVSHYGSLLDPSCSWLENLLMREYMECYLYWSFYTSETDKRMKETWELFLAYELSHLQIAKDLLATHENTQWEQVVEAEFPEPLHFKPTKDYVRDVLENQVALTANREEFVPVDALPEKHEYYAYQNLVNRDVDSVPSHRTIVKQQNDAGQDYRYEEKANPVEELRDRKKDNTTIGRKAGVAV
ncbi:MAG: hypothetical protein LUE17_02630 [Planctomycetaceae bacterium]|nr:hypothetical protein [Planctomycetaceae bacterium]